MWISILLCAKGGKYWKKSATLYISMDALLVSVLLVSTIKNNPLNTLAGMQLLSLTFGFSTVLKSLLVIGGVAYTISNGEATIPRLYDTATRISRLIMSRSHMQLDMNVLRSFVVSGPIILKNVVITTVQDSQALQQGWRYVCSQMLRAQHNRPRNYMLKRGSQLKKAVRDYEKKCFAFFHTRECGALRADGEAIS